MSLAIVIPAAGRSSRLGQAKQLVNAAGKPLLANTIHLAFDTIQSLSIPGDIYVVLGHRAHDIESKIKPHFTDASFSNIHIAHNTHWSKGLGSSIALGVRALMPQCHVSAVMVMLADQWALTTNDLQRLINTWQENPTSIVAASYQDTLNAVPAIFPRLYFDELCALTKQGAKAVLTRHMKNIYRVPLPNAAFDLDSPEHITTMQSALCCSANPLRR